MDKGYSSDSPVDGQAEVCELLLEPVAGGTRVSDLALQSLTPL